MKRKPRNPYLSAASDRILRLLRTPNDEDADSSENALTESCGRWYVGVQQVPKGIVTDLLRLCAVKSEDRIDDLCNYYWLTPEGERLRDDADYVPEVVRMLARRDSNA